MTQRILAVDDNPINLKIVSGTLTHAGYEVMTASSGSEALAKVNKIRPDLIILDVMMPDMDGYEVCKRLRGNSATAHTPIVMLTAHDTLEEKIKGFEVGADEYLSKPFQPAELAAHISALLRRAPASPPVKAPPIKARVIAVYSLRGGMGVSTLAANLGIALAQLWGPSTVLVDMCLAFGQTALMFNLPLRNTWADLAGIDAKELDADTVNQVLLTHSSGVSVLATSRKPEQGELITGEKVRAVLEALSRRFQYIVLDMPHDFRETTLAGLDAAEKIVLMMAPELAAVRATVGALEVFDSLKYPRDHIVLTLNWIFEKRGLARKDIEAVLYQSIELVIPFAPEAFVPAINLGVPPVLSAPISPMAALFEDFAFSLSKEEHQKTPPSTPGAALQRAMVRYQLHHKQK